MSEHRDGLATIFALALFLACSVESPSGPLASSDQAGISPAGEQVPFKATFETSFSLIPTSTPGVFLVPITGEGQARHMGRSTLTIQQTVDFNTGFLGGPTVITAANGDELHLSSAGSGSVPDLAGNVAFSAGLQVTGGTGRFSGATGDSLQGFGTANVATLTGEVTYLGTISSPGASKK